MKKFRTIGLDTEDKITEFIDYIDDLEDTEENLKSDVYGFFEEESSYNENHIPAYVVMTKYKRQIYRFGLKINAAILL